MESTNGFRGYIASRNIGGNVIPQRVQNLVIRSYAQGRSLSFLLSATEYYIDNCFMTLDALLEAPEGQLSGIIFYSMHMLPEDRFLRRHVYERTLNVGRQLHFALEEMLITSHDDVYAIEDIMLCKSLAVHELKIFE